MIVIDCLHAVTTCSHPFCPFGSVDQTEVYIHTNSPTLVTLPLSHLTPGSVRLLTTQLPSICHVAEHRHGWLAVVSLTGSLQVLNGDWQPLRMGSTDGELTPRYVALHSKQNTRL